MTRLGPKLKGTTGGGVTMTVVAAAFLLWAVLTPPSRPKASGPSITGRYQVRVAGYGKGAGTCFVTDQVDINCLINDDAGNQQRLRLMNVKLDGYRFRGLGTLDGVSVQVSGRVDPPDATAPAPHVMATFVAEDGRSGRIVGAHE